MRLRLAFVIVPWLLASVARSSTILRRKAVSLLMGLGVALICAPVFGGTVLNMAQASRSGGGFTVTIEGALLRIDSQADEEPSLILFRADEDRILFVDRERGTYIVVEGARLKSAAAQMKAEYSKQPDDDLPIGLRAIDQIDEWRETTEVREVNGHSCVVKQAYREGEKVQEFCVAALEHDLT